MFESLLAGLPLALPLMLIAASLPVVILGLRTWRVRLRDVKVEQVDLSRVPADARTILDAGRRWLTRRGFRYVSSWKIRPMTAKASRHYADVYAKGGVFAVVTPRERPSDTPAIEFQTVFSDGVVASTFNRCRHTILWEPPDWKVADDYVRDLDVALHNHAARAGALGKPVTDPAERDRIVNALREGFVERLVASGKAVRAADGLAHLKLGAAMAHGFRLLRGNSRAASVGMKPLVKPGARDARAA